MYAFSSKFGSYLFRALGDLTWNDPYKKDYNTTDAILVMNTTLSLALNRLSIDVVVSLISRRHLIKLTR